MRCGLCVPTRARTPEKSYAPGPWKWKAWLYPAPSLACRGAESAPAVAHSGCARLSAPSADGDRGRGKSPSYWDASAQSAAQSTSMCRSSTRHQAHGEQHCAPATTDEEGTGLFPMTENTAPSPDQTVLARLPGSRRCVRQPEIPEVNVQADRVSSSLSNSFNMLLCPAWISTLQTAPVLSDSSVVRSAAPAVRMAGTLVS